MLARQITLSSAPKQANSFSAMLLPVLSLETADSSRYRAMPVPIPSQKEDAEKCPCKSFIYRFYAESLANPFIYRI